MLFRNPSTAVERLFIAFHTYVQMRARQMCSFFSHNQAYQTSSSIKQLDAVSSFALVYKYLHDLMYCNEYRAEMLSHGGMARYNPYVFHKRLHYHNHLFDSVVVFHQRLHYHNYLFDSVVGRHGSSR